MNPSLSASGAFIEEWLKADAERQHRHNSIIQEWLKTEAEARKKRCAKEAKSKGDWL